MFLRFAPAGTSSLAMSAAKSSFRWCILQIALRPFDHKRIKKTYLVYELDRRCSRHHTKGLLKAFLFSQRPLTRLRFAELRERSGRLERADSTSAANSVPDPSSFRLTVYGDLPTQCQFIVERARLAKIVASVVGVLQ